MVNVVIYARFSSHSQTEQSIEGQLKECYEFAKRNEYNVIGEYIDRALTGTTDKRPEFLRMVEDSKKKTFKYVLVYQLDRFARNRHDSATYKAKLKKNGVRVLSAKENITEDASGILVEGVLESMAEYYSVELSQKIRRELKYRQANANFSAVLFLSATISTRTSIIRSTKARRYLSAKSLRCTPTEKLLWKSKNICSIIRFTTTAKRSDTAL